MVLVGLFTLLSGPAVLCPSSIQTPRVRVHIKLRPVLMKGATQEALPKVYAELIRTLSPFRAAF